MVHNSPNQFVIYSFNFSVFRGQKMIKEKAVNKKNTTNIKWWPSNKCVTLQSLKLVKISYCQFQSLTDTGLGKLGIMGKKKNSPSLWHDELAVCRGNRCYTKWAFSVLGTFWRIEMGWKMLWQTKTMWMHFDLFVCLFSCCAARQVSLVSPNLLLPWGSVPVSASGLSSSDVEMFYCSFVFLL